MNARFFDPDGNPISLEEWGRRFEDFGSRIVRRDELADGRRLLTLWLGYVDPLFDGARLFGTALISGSTLTELETYDSKADALVGHARHLAALS